MKKMRLYRIGLLLAIAGMFFAGCGSQGANDPARGANNPGMGATTDSGMTAKGDPAMGLMDTSHPAPRLKDIGLDDLLRPADGFVMSSIAVTTMQKDMVQPTLAVLGTVGYDTRLTNTISARVSGRIERLYVRYRYQHVKRGDPIMDIYSPDLQTGEEEYLYLLKNDPGNTTLIDAARQRLLLLGVGERQLAEVARRGSPSPLLTIYSSFTGHIHDAGNTMPEGDLAMGVGTTTPDLPIKEGMYVEKGQNIFQVFEMRRAWALLYLYPGQEAMVHIGDKVEVVPETAPGNSFQGRVDLVEPFYRQGRRSGTVRVYFDNSSREIPIGSAVKATIRTSTMAGSWLPKDAVLSLGSRRVVFLRVDGGFRAHAVATGITDGARVQLLSGLGPRDSVAANAQFLIDSEDLIKVNN